MPLPKPNPGESQDDFVSRCMGNDTMNEEFPEQDQRAAVCMSQFKKREHEMVTEENTVYDIDGVEVFRAGTWNGDKYTEKDLDDIVDAFNEIGRELKPYVKLGHDGSGGDKMMPSGGMPAVGWITALRRVGDKLLAKFSSMPKKIYELIQKKAYGRFSSEIYLNLEMNGKKYPKALKAVALLGAATPAVAGLDDFINLYENINYEEVKLCDKFTEKKMEQDIDVKKFEAMIAEKDNDLRLYELEVDRLNKENESLRKEKSDAEVAFREYEIKTVIDRAKEEGKIVPAQEEKFTELAHKDLEAVKDILENMPKIVEFGEQSQNIQPEKKANQKLYDAETHSWDDEALDEAVKAYRKEHPEVSYQDAMDKVLENEME